MILADQLVTSKSVSHQSSLARLLSCHLRRASSITHAGSLSSARQCHTNGHSLTSLYCSLSFQLFLRPRSSVSVSVNAVKAVSSLARTPANTRPACPATISYDSTTEKSASITAFMHNIMNRKIIASEKA